MKKPELAFARKEFEKGRAETPQEHRPKRFISDEDYQRFLILSSSKVKKRLGLVSNTSAGNLVGTK
jgi:hypothetical protein